MSLLRDDLLAPLPGDSRGENLRYAPVYDKIKEARQEDEDETNLGDWQRARKKADFAAVIKLASDALATKSKDLQLAVWLAEALVRKEGFAVLADCCHLLQELQARFWEILYPELEDGNPEFRSTPLEWFSSRCDYLLRRIPLTKKGLDWFKYQESHDTSREHTAMAGKASDDEKRTARANAVAEREAAALLFGESFDATPKSFYVTALGQIEVAQEALAALEAFCDEKYGKVSPSFSKFKKVLEEIQQAVSILLERKREKEPDEVPQAETPPETQEASPEAPTDQATAPARKAAVPQAEPTNPEEAYAVIGRAATVLRQLDPAAVVPYLLVRSLRWGELRSAGESLDASLLVAPSTEIRQNLKRLFNESNWAELLAATEAAAVLPCGRAWLDLHRYTWCGLSGLEYTAAANAICSELRALIADFPSLPELMLDDDTPVANSDTQKWLDERAILPKQPQAPEVFASIKMPESEDSAKSGDTNGAADQFATALELARNHQFPEAMAVLTGQPLRESSGRERFLRQLQISQLCLTTGQFAIAYPILHDLFSEIEERKLLEWESTNFVVQPLSLLVRCIDKTQQGADQRSQIYNLLCRLEPTEALKLQSS